MTYTIIEAIRIGVILGGCAAALFAKSKFQPEIERSLAKIEAEEATNFSLILKDKKEYMLQASA